MPSILEHITELWKELRRIGRKLDGFKGDGITNTPNGISLSIRQGARSFPSSPGGLETVVVHITSTLAGGGFYNGKYLTTFNSDAIDTSTDLAAADLGDFAADDDVTVCTVLNLLELGKSTHDLDPADSDTDPDQLYFVGKLLPNANGPYVLIWGAQHEDCS